MERSKLTFNIQELPEGNSSRTVDLKEGELSLSDEVSLKQGRVDIDFYKTRHFIEVKFGVTVEAEVLCDRSLRPFLKELSGSYYILFEPNPVDDEDSENGAVRQIPADTLQVDIADEVRDTVMLEIPVKKLHPDYLDPEGNPVEFETKKFGDRADEESIDPRWSALKKLK